MIPSADKVGGSKKVKIIMTYYDIDESGLFVLHNCAVLQ